MTPAAELGELTAFVDLYEAAPEDVGAKVEGIGGAAYLAPPAVPRSAMFNRAPRARAARDRGRPRRDRRLLPRVRVEWCAAVAPRRNRPRLAPGSRRAGSRPATG